MESIKTIVKDYVELFRDGFVFAYDFVLEEIEDKLMHFMHNPGLFGNESFKQPTTEDESRYVSIKLVDGISFEDRSNIISILWNCAEVYNVSNMFQSETDVVPELNFLSVKVKGRDEGLAVISKISGNDWVEYAELSPVRHTCVQVSEMPDTSKASVVDMKSSIAHKLEEEYISATDIRNALRKEARVMRRRDSVVDIDDLNIKVVKRLEADGDRTIAYFNHDDVSKRVHKAIIRSKLFTINKYSDPTSFTVALGAKL